MNRVRADVGPFAIVPLWLIEAGVSHGAIATYALLWAKWADRNGECYPSRAKIAEALDKSVRTTDGYLAELTAVGALLTENRYSDEGDLTSNLYTLVSVRGSAVDCTTPCSGLHDGSAADCTTVVQPTAHEPDPDEPDPMNPSSSALSEPTVTTSPDVSMSEDYDNERDDVDGLNDQGAGLSYPHPTISDPVAQARTILIEEGYDPEGVEKALTSTEAGAVVDAKWTTYRGTPYDADTLAESIRLAVAFADACDDGGNKRPNPYTHKECEPMRKLLLTDEKPSRHIRLLIRWTFDDDFWCSNVLCSRKFREKWDQLAGARRREVKKVETTKAREGSGVGEDWMARSAH